MKSEFWRDWKRVTAMEKAAIKNLKEVKRILLKEIHRNKINSIYVKGSFIRREMNKSSDVDLTIIVNDNSFIKKIEKLNEKCKEEYKPNINLGVHSLWELKNNKLRYKSKKPKGRPDLFVRKVKDYKLILGKKINPKDYPSRDDKAALEIRVKTFRNLFIPLYRKGEIGFSGLIKQVFWLVEIEEQVRGNDPPDSWKDLDKSIKDKKHIMHLTYKYRLDKPKDKKKREKFIIRIEGYLKDLDKLVSEIQRGKK